MKCVDCKYNWLKYIAVTFLPPSAFLVVIDIFKISSNSGLLMSYVTVSQMFETYNLAHHICM